MRNHDKYHPDEQNCASVTGHIGYWHIGTDVAEDVTYRKIRFELAVIPILQAFCHTLVGYCCRRVVCH